MANPLLHLSRAITALAANASGTIAVGLDSGGIVFHSAKSAPLDGFNCPIALAFDGPNDLYVCNGSDTHSPSDWAADLMQKNASGSVWHVSLDAGERRCLAKNLAFPYGVVVDAPEQPRDRIGSLAASAGFDAA